MRYVLWDVVDEQIDEAELLWERWEECLVSPRYTPQSLAEGPEERLFAVIDALASAGPAVARARLVPALEEGGPRASAAALALLEGGFEADVLAALRALEGSDSAASIRRALEVSGAAQAGLASIVDRASEALVTALARGHKDARAAYNEAVANGQRDALLLAGTSGDPRAIDDLVAALARPEIAAPALVALGASGRPAAAEACLPLLGDKALGKLAAEAFVSITGLPLAKPYLAAPMPGDDGSEAPIPVAEMLLPRLDAKAVEGFWSAERARFDRKKRYLRGAVMSGDVVLEALAEGSMRGRVPLALEITVRSNGAIDLPVRAPARRWIEAVRREGGVASLDFQRSFMER